MQVSDKRPDVRVERTREVVLAAVRDLLTHEGHHAVTPQRIASETGVSRSTIHRHWPELRELLIEALADPEPAEAMVPLLGDLRLDLGVDLHHLRLKLNDRQNLSVMVSLLGESITDEGFQQALRRNTSHHLCRLRLVLEAGHAEGTLPPDIDVDQAAASLAGPLFFRRLVLGEELTPEMVEAVVDGFIRAHARPRPTPT